MAKVRIIQPEPDNARTVVEIDGREVKDVMGVSVSMRPGHTEVRLSIFVEELVFEADCSITVLPVARDG